ncbi:MAG: tRNA uridine(34) 5-carboxymethylaminomethyl modification radical SAM/GNAT enzyme Elp3 [Candidatus Altiarchaeota archaeon]|nr:tRNA uridine(34) 5-carboxymethylaminomethyl modification radical SAM/GNAT enzyme Elp3 [Candidatus Altiarchaeota archaeon]
MKKPSRSMSGVAVIAVMSPSFICPGECVFCFKGPNAAKSYTGLEPSARRAIRHDYDPYEITYHRIKQLELNGHPTDKLDVIVMGGTFNFHPRDFQENFVKRIYDACNQVDSKTLKEAQKINETTKNRIIGLTFETRPDWASIDELNWMLSMGATRLEYGIQSTFNDVLELNKRGHLIEESMRATTDARDLGYKINHHIMPGLLGSTKKKDLDTFRTVFSEKLMPDMIKIYPTLVIEGSELWDLYKLGWYKPLRDEDAIEVISAAKALVPPWIRVMRIQRDVPATEIIDGVKKGNLRELAWKKMRQNGTKCRCIRCREARLETDLNPKLIRQDYEAGGATEVFLSFEDEKKDKLVGFLRLRLLKRFLRPELKDSAMVREVRVFGPEAKIGSDGVWQHKGYGKKLLIEAEKITKNAKYSKLSIISGVGVREYFRKFGYELNGPYMTKTL